jgi:hypothetical protein
VRWWSINLSYNTPVLKMGTGLGHLLCANSVVNNCVQNDSAAGVCHRDLQNSITYIIRGNLRSIKIRRGLRSNQLERKRFQISKIGSCVPSLNSRISVAFRTKSSWLSFSVALLALKRKATARMTLTMNCCRLSASASVSVSSLLLYIPSGL